MNEESGHVRAWHGDKGYGFIACTSYEGDLFFHVSDVQTGENSVRVGAAAQFVVEPSPSGLKARRVRLSSSGAVAASPRSSTVSRMPFNSIRVRGPAPVIDTDPKDFGTKGLPEEVEHRIAALLGFRERRGSPYAIGNAISKDADFRAAIVDLYESSKGAGVAGPSNRLVVTLANLLLRDKAHREPRLTNQLRVCITGLRPLIRIVKSGESVETHVAVEEVLARRIRAAAVANESHRPDLPQRAEVQPGPKQAPVPVETHRPAATAPKAVPVETHRPAVTAPNAEAPRMPAPPPAKDAVSTRFARIRAESFGSALRPVAVAMDRWMRAADAVVSNPVDPKELEALIETIPGTVAALQAASPALESMRDRPRTDERPLNEVLAEIDRRLGDAPLELGGPSLSADPRGVRDLLQLAELVTSIQTSALPAWAKDRLLGGSSDSVPRAVSHVLGLSSAERDAVAACNTWAQGLSSDANKALPQLEAPHEAVTHAGLLPHLQRELAAHMQSLRDDAVLAARLSAAADLLNPSLIDRIRSEWSRSDLDAFEQAEALIARLRALQENLDTKVFQELSAGLRRWPDDPGALHSIAQAEQAVDAIGGDVSRFLPTLKVLVESAEKRLRTPAQPSRPRQVQEVEPEYFSFEHPLSKGVGGVYSADLAWVEQPGQGYGVVSFPIRLKASKAPSKPFTYVLTAASDALLAGNSGDWGKVLPSTVQRTWPAGVERLDVVLPLPVRKLLAQTIAKENRNTSLQLTIAAGGRTSRGNLDWQGLSLDLPVYVSPFPQTVSLKEMQDRPLGVERHFKKLVPVVEQGRNSFRIHGPRRFGKTTLVTALCERFQASKTVAVLDRVVASDKRSPRDVWDDVVERLQRRFDRPISLNLADNGVPAAGVFDGVRRKAREMGFSTIYVIIDEAQALFAASSEPAKYGVALKKMLESEWGRPGDQHAALLLGLVGQAHLPTLMGADLIGAIGDEYSAATMDPDELLPILRRSGGTDLQSSSEARAALARQAGNFWVLDRLLRRIADSCFDQGRSWFVESDVEKAVERLVQDDRDGVDKTLWSYVRDVLNENDDKNVWTPSEAFPVAMAWAFMRSVGGDGDPTVAIMEALHEWGMQVGIVIEKGHVAAVFQSLRDQQIVRKDGSFELPLLERLLAARAGDQPFQEEVERRSLIRLGLKRVKAPAPAESGAQFSGGQASVERIQFGGRDLAVRRVRLADASAEQRFAREVSLLQKLGTTQTEVSPRARQHLPVLVDAGLDADATVQGVVMYEWVDGEPLRKNGLGSRGALTVLSGLTEALCLLGQVPPSGMVHRDIRPDNVIVGRADGEPVLVDFGLSIAVEEISNTTMVSGVLEYIPPEVKKDGSKAWSRAGDVYSLGKTIEACLDAGARSDERLTGLLARMSSEAAADRPQPEEILAETAKLLRDREIMDHDAQIVASFDEVVRLLPAYAQDAVKLQRGDFASAIRGTSRERVALPQVAEFLENLLQAFVKREHPDVRQRVKEDGKSTFLLKFAALDGLPQQLATLACCEAQAVGLLRNAASHGADFDRIYEAACRALSRPDGKPGGVPQLKEAEVKVARELGRLFKVTGIAKLVEKWTQAC